MNIPQFMIPGDVRIGVSSDNRAVFADVILKIFFGSYISASKKLVGLNISDGEKDLLGRSLQGFRFFLVGPTDFLDLGEVEEVFGRSLKISGSFSGEGPIPSNTVVAVARRFIMIPGVAAASYIYIKVSDPNADLLTRPFSLMETASMLIATSGGGGGGGIDAESWRGKPLNGSFVSPVSLAIPVFDGATQQWQPLNKSVVGVGFADTATTAGTSNSTNALRGKNIDSTTGQAPQNGDTLVFDQMTNQWKVQPPGGGVQAHQVVVGPSTPTATINALLSNTNITEVFFQEGVYALINTLLVLDQGITKKVLRGAGLGTIIQMEANAAPAIMLQIGRPNVVVEDMVFRLQGGRGFSSDIRVEPAPMAPSCDNVEFHRCKFESDAPGGLLMEVRAFSPQYARGLKFIDCDFSFKVGGSGRTRLYIAGTGPSPYDQIDLVRCSVGGPFQFTNCTNVRVSECMINTDEAALDWTFDGQRYTISRSYIRGYRVQPKADDVAFLDNHFVAIHGAQPLIVFADPLPHTGLIISGNKFFSEVTASDTQGLIGINGPVMRGITITGNLFRQMTPLARCQAIVIDALANTTSHGIVIANNIIEEFGFGINAGSGGSPSPVDSGARGMVIAHNHISRTLQFGAGVVGSYSIFVNRNAVKTVVKGNVCIDADAVGQKGTIKRTRVAGVPPADQLGMEPNENVATIVNNDVP